MENTISLHFSFNACTELKDVTISEGVSYVGDRAFRMCTSLESITIPESVTYIGEDAFKTKME